MSQQNSSREFSLYKQYLVTEKKNPPANPGPELDGEKVQIQTNQPMCPTISQSVSQSVSVPSINQSDQANRQQTTQLLSRAAICHHTTLLLPDTGGKQFLLAAPKHVSARRRRMDGVDKMF